jgi:transcriptional regulator with XRE-family HTH domain
MKTKSTLRERSFVSGTSQFERIASTFRLQVARDEQQRREMGQRIKEMRAARNLKQQTIADTVGVSLRQYQNWQAGENTPDPDHLDKLAEILKVTPEWLLRGDTPDPFTASRGSSNEQLDRIETILEALRLEVASLGLEVAKLLDGAPKPKARAPRQQRR